MEKKKVYGFLEQAFIYALILLIANGIASISPIPLPPSLIGMVLLFLALCLNIIKLEQVEGLGNNLSKIISFLFVPSGISLITSLDIMAK
ncbi:MAG: CidA/LrgA family protein, partial [Vagococcus sp.]